MGNNFLLLIIISYFFGSIPFAYILTLMLGYGDIRKIGSGNVGATNVLRTGKKSLAIAVLALDILKGFLPITIFLYYYRLDYISSYLIFIGSISIIGHIFPIWLKFKGGKGVATYIGFIFGIDYMLGIVFVLSWIIVSFIKKYSSLASISSLIVLPLYAIIFSYNQNIIYILIFISFLIIIKHTSNIKRLLNGSEIKIKF
jgi:glycerol-3-phosphate acyltransferase PlsY